MRKVIIMVVSLVAGLAFAAGPATADDTPSSKCEGAPVATGTDGESSVSVCVEGIGATTAAQKDSGGYIVADGDDGNPLTAASQCLDGHIGVEVFEDSDGPARVVSSDGEDESGTTDESYEYPQGAPDADPDPSVCQYQNDDHPS